MRKALASLETKLIILSQRKWATITLIILCTLITRKFGQLFGHYPFFSFFGLSIVFLKLVLFLIILYSIIWILIKIKFLKVNEDDNSY
ncbi:hypothetical protein [Enterococcus sp. DIV0800]|uniref:hypothetical protein n=1 Tax=unclassified Enterococcus TaxID=2608891 RepID=UPI003D2FA8E5